MIPMLKRLPGEDRTSSGSATQLSYESHSEAKKSRMWLATELYPRVISIVLALFLSLTTIAIWRTDPKHGYWLLMEGGPIEGLTAVLWILAACICVLSALRSPVSRLEWILGSVVLFLFAARELDLQKVLEWNAGTLANYWNPDIPLTERLMVLLVVILPACSITVAFAARTWGPFWKAWRDGLTWTRDVVIWCIMLVIATQLDKIHHVMPTLGVDSSYRYLPHAFEEVLELVLALYVFLLLFPLWKHASRRALQSKYAQPVR